MKSLFGKILNTPVVTESVSRAAEDQQIEVVAGEIDARVRKLLGRSLHIREVDAGSCNGCEIESTALTNPYYDLERFGLHFVASPRHADCLLVTGPVTRNVAEPLRLTYEATPDPKIGDRGRRLRQGLRRLQRWLRSCRRRGQSDSGGCGRAGLSA
jgi:hypothetical protein